MQESEGGPWYFYIATPLVGEDGARGPAYDRVGALIQDMPQPFWVDPLEFKVVAPGSAVGKAIRDIADRRPGPMPLPCGSERLGGLTIDGAYIYPADVAPVR
ncbi:MAG TPA: hypothetical protein VMS17_09980 [Gemmataceae bacterium]|nr:hypothetical protein [Gemmataceae bacterium]